MAKIKLIKKEYTGLGYWHCFNNNETGELVYEETTKEAYDKLGERGGSKYNPIKNGYTWFNSGGSINVDTPSKHLEDNQYTIVGDRAWMKLGGERVISIPKDKIINNEITIL